MTTFDCDICGREAQRQTRLYDLMKHHYCSLGCMGLGKRIFPQKKQRPIKPRKEGQILDDRHGVRFNEKKQKWCARIRYKSRMIQLGSFTDQREAILAREEAERKYL